MSEAAGPAAAGPDLERLADWINRNVAPADAGLQAVKFSDGQSNPTYMLDTGQRKFVLRRKPTGQLLPSAHQVDREFRVMKALRDSGVPVPACHALCTDTEVIGSMFYVMDCVEGRHFADTLMPGIEPPERAMLYDAMNETIARLHSVDPAAVGLADFGRPGNYFSRQIDRWSRQYKASELEPIAAMDRLIGELPQHIPAGDEARIVHGDYRTDNLIFHATEARVIAVLDWELSTLGDPAGDLGYQMMLWRLPRGAYRFGLADSDLGALGIPDEAAYLASYCRRTGRAGVDHWEFYIVYNLFRLAAILQGIAARAAAGNASNARAAESGARAREIAAMAWAGLQKL